MTPVTEQSLYGKLRHAHVKLDDAIWMSKNARNAEMRHQAKYELIGKYAKAVIELDKQIKQYKDGRTA